MAYLNKLAIRGIRSFDNNNIAIIEFYHPVTVIVGHNGSGKTTIIECLKYATTGEQPPNTRGGAFVHDPKMANEKEVKAQVKLRFSAANGTKMLAVRNLSVTVKKTTGFTMKTLESILAAEGNGEKGGKRGTISTKCAELDAEIPQLLGVSKAVLENVIFCHQEDSYWPLAEPGILKKKFDDIFEATKYTKALDNIKALRKDRVADLKAEKERLIGLSREKQYMDKLKEKIKDISTSITAKDVEWENVKEEHDRIAEANRTFTELNSKFREIYKEVENLESLKAKTLRDLEEARESVLEELHGTDEELARQQEQFQSNTDTRRRALSLEEDKLRDIEDEIRNFSETHGELLSRKGRLSSEAETQRGRISEREALIRESAKQHHIQLPAQKLERDQVVEFMSQITDIQRKQKAEFEKLQADLTEKSDEYHAKIRKLSGEAQKHESKRDNLQAQVKERNASIRSSEGKLDDQARFEMTLSTTKDEIKQRQERVEKLKGDIASANYEERMQEKAEHARQLEDKREALLEESRALSMQANVRAKLDLKRGEIKTKAKEIQSTQTAAIFKFQELVDRKPKPESIEQEIDSLFREKEEEHDELQQQLSSANSTRATCEKDINTKRDEILEKQKKQRAYETKIQNYVAASDFDSFEDALVTAPEELSICKNLEKGTKSSIEVYDSIIKKSRSSKRCATCLRGLSDDEMKVVERTITQLIAAAKAKDDPAVLQPEIKMWEEEIAKTKLLEPVHRDLVQLNKELPMLKDELDALEKERPVLVEEAERLSDRVDKLKVLLKDLAALKNSAAVIGRLEKEIEKTESEVGDLETELSMTGSTKTVDDVQNELNNITTELRALEKERQNLAGEKERQQTALRTFESKFQSLQLAEQRTLNELSELRALAERVEQMKKDVVTFQAEIKELDAKMQAAQAPIQSLEDERKHMQEKYNAKINLAQTRLQELNISFDKISVMNKAIERYIKERKGRELDECLLRIQQVEDEMNQANERLEASRQVIKKAEREISESNATFANIRDNRRVRKLQREIVELQQKIEACDVEEAARAKRNYETQWAKRQAQENALKDRQGTLQGELNMLRTQLNSLEGDMKEFKHTNKRYTEQLVRVKISDMANNDLEKYAKALDNAIMKYHSLKMEEVNDTMKHLWNKTYQGTDIDGIKIRSDVEGGASKRSYNYRVVMTKDQVEMDMRGRCSAGQKMLASIIIRLALSDSFGQNCGILALDEPTNALDTENIDALAESLVDIINERKSHSNFQLIVITHDENFLRKLGQANVMEYYWRVKRDSRQKSIIEQQRYR